MFTIRTMRGNEVTFRLREDGRVLYGTVRKESLVIRRFSFEIGRRETLRFASWLIRRLADTSPRRMSDAQSAEKRLRQTMATDSQVTEERNTSTAQPHSEN
jgi:hypothetical protein